MADTRPIPTPLAYRWRRFLQQILPVIIFAFGIVVTIWLWDRHSLMGNAVGVVESQFVDVSSGTAGILLPPEHGRWETFQTVKKNDVIGEVGLYDFDVFEAQMATIEKQKAKVHADFQAERERFKFDTRLRNQGQWFDEHRLYWEVQEYMLNIKDRATSIEVSNAQLKRLQKSLEYFEETFKRGATSEQEVFDNRLQKDVVESRIKQEQIALDVANKRLKTEVTRLRATRARLNALNNGQSAEIGKIIEALALPYVKEIDVLAAQAKEIEAQLNALVIRAPFDGIIRQVFAVPGQSIQPGDFIVRIADANAHYIVSYIRHQQRIRPWPNMLVKVRTRSTGSRPVDARVLDVGQYVEEVPLHHRSDPAQPEWGFPVKIEVPPKLLLRPGEAIEIIFPRRAKTAEDPKSGPARNLDV